VPGHSKGWPRTRGPLKVLAPLYGDRDSEHWAPYWVDHNYVIKTADGPIYVSEPYAKTVSGNRLVGVGKEFARDVQFLRGLGWNVTVSMEAAHHKSS
jgi:hypothetical protein